MRCFFLFLNLWVLLTNVVNVASLRLKLQPQTPVGTPTLVLWIRDDTDPNSLKFDLRFVQGDADVGLALAGLEMGEDDTFGKASVTFPAEGQFVLKAVTGSQLSVVGTSNQVSAVGLDPASTSGFPSGSSATTLAPTATPPSNSASNTASSSTSTPTPISPPTSNSPPNASSTSRPQSVSKLVHRTNIPAIVGGIIGALLLLALLALLFVFYSRHRKAAAAQRRLTFHRDMMVQPRLMIQPRAGMASAGLPPPPSLPLTLPVPLPSESMGDPEGNRLDRLSTATGFTGVTGSTTDAIAYTGYEHEHEHDADHLDVDLEQGLPTSASFPRPPQLTLGSGHIVPSPKGPRPSIKRTTVSSSTSTAASTTTASSPVSTFSKGKVGQAQAAMRSSGTLVSIIPRVPPTQPLPPPPLPPKSPIRATPRKG
ncbi:hypothetical protein GALMADRAFT_255882 [Galerina marginata CBS 339.88]|uniref:Uncharacterized protein n=1 Tax=Galerina marginata (strain CBS 339.88) TaxID=685588 RepID=A0A067SHB9_GALM3|nr:hypothetical protein GALMADRAFT_255882 [Galerina marginata CBS 339.88]